MKHVLLGVVFLTSIVTMLMAQTVTDVQGLRDFAARKQQEWQRLKQEAEAYAQQHGIPIRQELPNGTIIEIMRLENGIPLFYITQNADASRTTQTERLYPGGTLGLSLTGAGYNRLGEWDGGAVRNTHQEFGNRVTQVDGATSISNHATHVAGTMIAAGVDAQAKGMAYEANLRAFDWNSDESEMANEAAAGLELSNHSYGYITGWYYDGLFWHWYGDVSVDQNEAYQFGFYDSQAQSWDSIAYQAPYYLIVKSAGNDRDDDGPAPGTSHSHNGSGSFTDSHYGDGYDNGFDNIRSAGVSKNVLTVGAVNVVYNYDDASSVLMSSFSSWGPTDDGRIKPDIVGNGVGVYSSTGDADNSYATYDGTSMASPNVTGTLALLRQHYENTHGGQRMRAATLKALVIHTADEAGDNPGPDYSYGWGLLNAKRAANKITEDTYQNVIDELVLNDGNTYTRTVTASGKEPLKVTIVWTDPPGTPVAPALDPPDPMLVNDLDLRIEYGGNIYYPWKLDRNNPSAPATRNSKNSVDNVEQVVIDNPVAGGVYTIVVDHAGTLTNGSQAFSIIISGMDEFSSPPQHCSGALIRPGNGATNVDLATIIEWEEVADATSYDLYFGTDGGGTTTPTNIENGTNITGTRYSPNLQPNTTYYVQVVPRNSQGAATGCSTIWSFTTGGAAATSTFPYTENFDGFTNGIGSGNNWENATDDDFDWETNTGTTPSNGTGPNGDHTTGSGIYLFTEASSPNYPSRAANLLTPYFDWSAENNPTLEFWYHMMGADVGDLVVDVYGNGQWNNAVFSVSGQQSTTDTDWKVATIYLNDYKGGSIQRIRFRVLTGGGWQGDIAIDDFTIRGEAFHTFLAGETTKHTFQNTGAAVQFTVANSGQVTLEAVRIDGDPGVVGSLPTGVVNYSKERYWRITELSGTADGTYSLSLDLAGMSGISNYSTLYLLKRADSSSPWQVVGTNNYSGSGTIVEWTGITGGFSEFAIGGAADNALPVQLALFEADVQDERVVLRWRTESEIDNQGFILYRRTEADTTWEVIADFIRHKELRGQGTTNQATEYQFVDESVEAGTTYWYRLADVDYAGNINTLQEVQVHVTGPQIPEEFTLLPAYPNPFNPVVNVRFGLPEARHVRVEVFDITGRRIYTLVDEKRKAGWHTVQWQGVNQSGHAVGSGAYFIRIQAEEDVRTLKALLLK